MSSAPGFVSRIRRIHPGFILAALDLVGLAIAGYLSVVELRGGLPACGPLKGCEQVALSEYAWVGGIPVAVFGVALSISLGIFVIGAVCVWCASYALSLVARFAVALFVPRRRAGYVPS